MASSTAVNRAEMLGVMARAITLSGGDLNIVNAIAKLYVQHKQTSPDTPFEFDVQPTSDNPDERMLVNIIVKKQGLEGKQMNVQAAQTKAKKKLRIDVPTSTPASSSVPTPTSPTSPIVAVVTPPSIVAVGSPPDAPPPRPPKDPRDTTKNVEAQGKIFIEIEDKLKQFQALVDALKVKKAEDITKREEDQLERNTLAIQEDVDTMPTRTKNLQILQEERTKGETRGPEGDTDIVSLTKRYTNFDVAAKASIATAKSILAKVAAVPDYVTDEDNPRDVLDSRLHAATNRIKKTEMEKFDTGDFVDIDAIGSSDKKKQFFNTFIDPNVRSLAERLQTDNTLTTLRVLRSVIDPNKTETSLEFKDESVSCDVATTEKFLGSLLGAVDDSSTVAGGADIFKINAESRIAAELFQNLWAIKKEEPSKSMFSAMVAPLLRATASEDGTFHATPNTRSPAAEMVEESLEQVTKQMQAIVTGVDHNDTALNVRSLSVAKFLLGLFDKSKDMKELHTQFNNLPEDQQKGFVHYAQPNQLKIWLRFCVAWSFSVLSGQRFLERDNGVMPSSELQQLMTEVGQVVLNTTTDLETSLPEEGKDEAIVMLKIHAEEWLGRIVGYINPKKTIWWHGVHGTVFSVTAIMAVWEYIEQTMISTEAINELQLNLQIKDDDDTQHTLSLSDMIQIMSAFSSVMKQWIEYGRFEDKQAYRGAEKICNEFIKKIRTKDAYAPLFLGLDGDNGFNDEAISDLTFINFSLSKVNMGPSDVSRQLFKFGDLKIFGPDPKTEWVFSDDQLTLFKKFAGVIVEDNIEEFVKAVLAYGALLLKWDTDSFGPQPDLGMFESKMKDNLFTLSEEEVVEEWMFESKMKDKLFMLSEEQVVEELRNIIKEDSDEATKKLWKQQVGNPEDNKNIIASVKRNAGLQFSRPEKGGFSKFDVAAGCLFLMAKSPEKANVLSKDDHSFESALFASFLEVLVRNKMTGILDALVFMACAKDGDERMHPSMFKMPDTKPDGIFFAYPGLISVSLNRATYFSSAIVPPTEVTDILPPVLAEILPLMFKDALDGFAMRYAATMEETSIFAKAFLSEVGLFRAAFIKEFVKQEVFHSGEILEALELPLTCSDAMKTIVDPMLDKIRRGYITQRAWEISRTTKIKALPNMLGGLFLVSTIGEFLNKLGVSDEQQKRALRYFTGSDTEEATISFFSDMDGVKRAVVMTALNTITLANSLTKSGSANFEFGKLSVPSDRFIWKTFDLEKLSMPGSIYLSENDPVMLESFNDVCGMAFKHVLDNVFGKSKRLKVHGQESTPDAVWRAAAANLVLSQDSKILEYTFGFDVKNTLTSVFAQSPLKNTALSDNLKMLKQRAEKVETVDDVSGKEATLAMLKLPPLLVHSALMRCRVATRLNSNHAGCETVSSLWSLPQYIKTNFDDAFATEEQKKAAKTVLESPETYGLV